MCGIIGFHGSNVTKKDLDILRKVMIESKIRGKHASGIAWCNGRGKILSVVESIPIDELVDKFGDFKVMVNNNQIAMIAHARYSTSDIRYNQPLIGEHIAIAHNGVITQTPPESWEKSYGYKCKTCNDSELLLKALENHDDIWDKFPNSSIALVGIKSSGELFYIRNGVRPLWMGKTENGCIYTSTYDILKRSGVVGITKVSPADCIEFQRRSKCL